VKQIADPAVPAIKTMRIHALEPALALGVLNQQMIMIRERATGRADSIVTPDDHG